MYSFQCYANVFQAYRLVFIHTDKYMEFHKQWIWRQLEVFLTVVELSFEQEKTKFILFLKVQIAIQKEKQIMLPFYYEVIWFLFWWI